MLHKILAVFASFLCGLCGMGNGMKYLAGCSYSLGDWFWQMGPSENLDHIAMGLKSKEGPPQSSQYDSWLGGKRVVFSDFKANGKISGLSKYKPRIQVSSRG